jgi:[ribosomal protein S5]-alanine N-acetyltransferase
MNERLETDRLLLRKPERTDIPALVAGLGDWDVAKNLGRVPFPYSEADAHEFFDRLKARSPDEFDLTFGIALKTDAAYIGGCGVHLRDNGEFELGYWIGRPQWGRGYATEAARAVVQAAFAEPHIGAITAGHYFDNPPSGHVLAKLGFVSCGEELRECRARAHRVRCHAMLLTRQAFQRKHAA